jgi:thiamine biosynthesis lipoprotein
LNDLLSDYDLQSELNRLAAAGPMEKGFEVGPELWATLSRAQQLAEQTDGAFDVTVGPYSRLWRRARRQHALPSAERLAEAKAVVGYQNLKLEPTSNQKPRGGKPGQSETGTVRVLKEKMQLDLGGIAKGYAADEALAVLREAGIEHAMVAASGDMAFGAPPPGETGWRIGIAPLSAESKEPSVYLRLAHCGVSTSGDAFQHVEIDGKRYSHIIDPRTGIGLTRQSSVTIVAKDGMTADSLATAVSVVGEKAGEELLKEYPGAEMLFVRNDAGKIAVTRSDGFDKSVESKKSPPEMK